MRERGISFYHVHAPLDMHPEVSASRLVAGALGLSGVEEYYPIASGIPGEAAIAGDTDARVDDLARRLAAYLGPSVPVSVVTRHRAEAGRVAVVAGGGADRDILAASLERGCRTYVTGNTVTRCRIDFVQRGIREFREMAERERVSVIDATHHGTELPPQLEMVEWFAARDLPCEFAPDGPK
jgi:putative NIF3 family GTP cyclohydrolase 1 type 2